MKRQILFRGKAAPQCSWIYGEYVTTDETPKIYERRNGETRACWDYKVDPETVGEFTGMFDAVGQRIFEDDITRVRYEGKDYIGLIQYDAFGVFIFVARGFGWIPLYQLQTEQDTEKVARGEKATLKNIRVIGNMHENASYLEDGIK